MNGVLVIVPSVGLFSQSLDLVRGIAGQLAALERSEWVLGVIGPEPILAETYSGFCETIYTIFDPRLDQSSSAVWLDGFEALIRAASPQWVIAPHAGVAPEVLARLAARDGGAAVFGVTAVAAGDDQSVRFDRPIFGGKALARMRVHAWPAWITVRAGAPAGPAAAGALVPRIETLNLPSTSIESTVRLRERLAEAGEGPRLEEAKVIISGGRGLGGAQAFERLERVAELLQGAVGASRAAVDAGWVPTALQIGQTGKSVSPDLYVAVGISGASQHLAGISAAKHVLAINRDAEASIFSRADLGIVGDWSTVLPMLEEAIVAARS